MVEIWRDDTGRAEGDMPMGRVCAFADCGLHGELCAYVDRRGRACTTAWCAAHRVLIGDALYCRRHASTLMAVGDVDRVGGPPDVDNRVPGLVHFVATAIDDSVRQTLRRAASEESTLLVDGLRRLPARGNVGRRDFRWVETWKLVDHGGVVTSVSVEAHEDEPTAITALVDAQLVGRGVPPWIARRDTAEGDPGSDESRRTAFLDAIRRSVENAVRSAD